MVVSAVLELGTTHWGIALVALPLLVANVVLAWLAYPALLLRTIVALVAFLVAIALGGVVAWSGDATWAAALHVGACRRRARARARRRGRRVPRRGGAARVDARLPHADEAADHDAAPADGRRRDVRRRAGRAAARAVRGDHARARARLRGSLGAQPRARSRHRRAHGIANRATPGRVRSRDAGAGARVRDRALRRLVRAPGLGGQRADRGSRARREPLLRPRLHALAEALDAAEHRHRRRGRGRAAARRATQRRPDRSRCLRSGSSSSCSCGRRRTSGRSR